METLYDRIGGAAAIKQLVTTFYQHVLADPELEPFFRNTALDKLERMQQEFFAIALGGPPIESNISIYEAHQGRGIERKHLARFTDHLLSTLRIIGIDDDAAKEVYARISAYSEEVLGETGVDG